MGLRQRTYPQDPGDRSISSRDNNRRLSFSTCQLPGDTERGARETKPVEHTADSRSKEMIRLKSWSHGSTYGCAGGRGRGKTKTQPKTKES